MTTRALLFAAFLAATTGLAHSAPDYMRVIDVASDDTLNVRAAPSGSSEDIGDIPHDAIGIEVSGYDGSGKWARILWQEGEGWISARFLAPDEVTPRLGPTALPSGLLCGGTEPFWSVRLANGYASFSDISGDFHSLTISGARVAEGRPNFPLQMGLGGDTANANAFIRPASCNDGMSDRTYPYQVDFLLSTNGAQRYLDGCCSLPLEVGNQ